MIKVLQTSLFASLFVIVLACQTDNKDRILDVAEECMEVCPDSSIRMLEKMKGLTFNFDYQYAKFALLWTQASHKCCIPLENDSLINVAVDYYTIQEDRHYAAKALLYKGLVHKENHQVEKAAEAFALSERWFEDVEDNQYKALLYNHFGALMKKEGNYEEALHYLKKSYHYELKGDSIHYILSACGAIANTFELLGRMDSAKVYFEKGLQYRESVAWSNYLIFLQNYGNFLRKNKEYSKAEMVLHECEQYIIDEQRFSVYSCLATLYYDTKDYHKSIEYARKMLESEDSLMLRGCYLHLYRSYSQMGMGTEATMYRELFLRFHSDITMRLKTVEVTKIPHQICIEFLQADNQRVQWRLIMWIIVIMVTGFSLLYFVRRHHKVKERALQNDLFNEKIYYENELEVRVQEKRNLQNAMNWEIGRLKEYLSRRKKHLEDLEKDLLQKKKKVKEKNDEIDLLRKRMSDIEGENEELRDIQRKTVKENKRLHEIVHEAEHDEQIKKQIALLQLRGTDKRTIGLLVQLKHGNLYVGEQIPQEEVWPLITALLDDTLPEMRQRMDALTGNPTKRMMCYLMALELDDEEMMYRATGKRLETIRKYHKECRQLVDSWMG